LRMFDVSKDNYATQPDEKTYPNATVRIDWDQFCFIRDSLAGIEFVPVVYITLDALKAMKDHEDVLAENITTRVRNMCEYNELPNVEEIQLDCDWTATTEESFFRLCESVKKSIAGLGLPWRLSSTIRLHQLARRVPPVDNGVLMVYNTGSFDNPDTRNSIIDFMDVEPYLKRLGDYSLHLDVAYPTYSWQLLFRNRKFVGLLNGMEVTDSAAFIRRDKNLYVAKRDVPYNGMFISKGDMIRVEEASFADVAKVKDRIERYLSGVPHSNIIYHLDSKNLSKYTTDEIENIYTAMY
ncbi:MAG: hypothetical protein K2M12_01955, partial [Muribaculaceae bacterium]|nr:hypothetical protein [Muribaculaceae bacterium]